MDEEKLNEDQENSEAEPTPEETAAAWENYVRQEINTILNIFLPEAVNGNFGIKYLRPVIMVDPKSGKRIIDEKKATGVQIFIEFDFADTVEFFDDFPEESKP